jgi:hypothetical protein
MKQYKKAIIYFVAFYFFLVAIPGHFPTYADEISIKITPNVLTLQTQKEKKKNFIIENQGTETIALTLILKMVKPNNETGTITYLQPDLKQDEDPFLKDISITEAEQPINQFKLGPKQKKELTISIKDTVLKEKEYYFSILFLTTPQVLQDTDSQTDEKEIFASTPTQIALALPVILSTSLKNEINAFLNEFSSPMIIQTGPVPFTIRITNHSSHFIQPKGIMLITNMFGQTIGKLNLTEPHILPESSRSLLTTNQLPTDTQAIWNEKILFGVYTAQLSLALSERGPIINRKIYFIALPIPYLLFFLMGFLIIFTTFIFKKNIPKP